MKKKALFVINTLSKAGAEVALLELLKRFPKDEFETDLFVLMAQGELATKLPEGVRLLNPTFEVSSVLSAGGKRYMKERVLKTGFSGGSVFKNLPYLVTNGFRMAGNKNRRWENLLWKVLSDGAERFDTVYDLAVAFLEGGSAYYVADHVRAKKKAAVLHVDYARAGYFPSLDKLCYDKLDRIFCVSGEVREAFLEAYPECREKTELLYNIIDQEAIRRKAREGEGFSDGFTGKRILTVGRLTPQKGYDFAIDVMEELKKKKHHARWYVMGEGPLKEELEKGIRSKGLTSEFVLLGAKENPYPFLAQCDIYAHLTRFEGRSVAIQEALTLGRPVIASDCSGNREQIEDRENGILCPYTKEDAVRELSGLLTDPEERKRLGEAAERIVFNGEKEIEKLIRLLSEGGTSSAASEAEA